MSEVNEWNKKVIAEFRANEGKVGGSFEGKICFFYTHWERRVSRNALIR